MGQEAEKMDQVKPQAQEAQAKPRGTALVREKLIGPLMSLPRPKRVSAADHEAALAKLAQQLAYLSPRALDGLCELALVTSAGGKACPAVDLIRSWAYQIERPPITSSDYALSLMASAMGREAMETGYAVELLRHARRFGPPPGKYVISDLRDQARVNLRRRTDMVAVQAKMLSHGVV